MDSGLFWEWSWLAGVSLVIFLGLFLLPWFFFLLNLQALLTNVSPENRRMSPGMVWLNFIPVFNLGWFIYTVVRVRDSVLAEFRTRAWYVDGDLGYNVGLTAGVLWIASFCIGWIPFIGWVLPLAGIVCWIVYWLKTSDLKNRLDESVAWHGGKYSSGYGPQYPPYPVRYPRGYYPPGPAGPGPMGPQPPAAAPPGAGEPTYEGPGGEPPAGETPSETPRGEGPDGSAQTPFPGPDPQVLRCRACGAGFDLGDWFCRKCGSRLY